MAEYSFTLRAAQPKDSAAIADLIADVDSNLTTYFLIDPYTAIMGGAEDRMAMVVAECHEYDGLVGMGTVRFGSLYFNGTVLPFAGLDGLKVREQFRKHGLGRKLAEWRIDQARQAFGDQGVILTGLLRDNHASRAVATKWCREFIEPVRVVIRGTRAKSPRPLANMTIREIEPPQYEEWATKRNSFYQNRNLYKATDSTSIANYMKMAPDGRQIYRVFGLLDRAGNLLAGVRLWLRGQIKMEAFNNPPLPLRMINRVAHLLPDDYKIREIAVDNFWYAPGQQQAAQNLWQAIRWHGSAYGTNLTISLDPRDPLLDVVQFKPWHRPRFEVTIALHGPEPIDRNRLVTGLVRI